MSLATDISGPGASPACIRRNARAFRCPVANMSASSSLRSRRSARSSQVQVARMSALSRSGDRASATGPLPSLPTVARSFISVVRATRQPPLTSPSR